MAAARDHFTLRFAPPRRVSGDVSEELVMARDPSGPRAEAFRALRSRLAMRWPGPTEGARSLAIVSPGAGEGRSHVAANLAVAFALSGERTLLIDGDLHSARQHRIFDVRNQAGLTEVLARGSGAVAPSPLPEFGPLWVLAAGDVEEGPREAFSRSAFGELVAGLRAEFDVVLFDTPPSQLSVDSHWLAFHAGHALLVARRDRTSFADLSLMLRELSAAGVRVLGSVYNAF